MNISLESKELMEKSAKIFIKFFKNYIKNYRGFRFIIKDKKQFRNLIDLLEDIDKKVNPEEKDIKSNLEEYEEDTYDEKEFIKLLEESNKLRSEQDRVSNSINELVSAFYSKPREKNLVFIGNENAAPIH